MSEDYTYEVSLNKIQEIAFRGITRALRFAKFAQTGEYNLEKINNYEEPGSIISYDITPPIKPEEYEDWLTSFLNWTFNNSVNEIIESFYVYLEYTVVALEQKDTKIPLKKGDNINEVVRKYLDESRKNFCTLEKIEKALKQRNIEFSGEEGKIIRSFAEIRNLITHNLGLVGERRNLAVQNKSIALTWYYSHFFFKGDSSKEEKEIADGPFEEDGCIFMRLAGLQNKTIKLEEPIIFTCREVQQIGWTFWLLVQNIHKKANASLKVKEPAE